MSNILLVDSNNLCHKAYHTTGELLNGVIYGFFRQVLSAISYCRPAKVGFYFDVGESFRCNVFKDYKQRRKDADEALDGEEQHRREDMYKQIRVLRKSLLKELGFQNIIFKEGYEADDLIAAWIEEKMTRDDNVLICSSDKDLYQLLKYSMVALLRNGVKATGIKEFKDKYGIHPKDWTLMRAWMGDPSDSVPGIPGVGEKTALKIVKGLKAIPSYEKEVLDRNIQLFALPWPGTPAPDLVKDKPDPQQWRRIMKEMKMASLISWFPSLAKV